LLLRQTYLLVLLLIKYCFLVCVCLMENLKRHAKRTLDKQRFLGLDGTPMLVSKKFASKKFATTSNLIRIGSKKKTNDSSECLMTPSLLLTDKNLKLMTSRDVNK